MVRTTVPPQQIIKQHKDQRNCTVSTDAPKAHRSTLKEISLAPTERLDPDATERQPGRIDDNLQSEPTFPEAMESKRDRKVRKHAQEEVAHVPRKDLGSTHTSHSTTKHNMQKERKRQKFTSNSNEEIRTGVNGITCYYTNADGVMNKRHEIEANIDIYQPKIIY